MLQSWLAPVLRGTTLPAASSGCTVTPALPDLPPQQGRAAAPLCPRTKPWPPCQPTDSQCQRHACQLPSQQQRRPPRTGTHHNLLAGGWGTAAGGSTGRQGWGYPKLPHMSLRAAPEVSPACPTPCPSPTPGLARAHQPEHGPTDAVGTSAPQ